MEIFVSQFVLFFLLFTRIVSMISVAPIFGNVAVPMQFKVAISLFFSFIFFPIAAKTFSPQIGFELFSFVILILQEIVVGLLMGFSVSMIFFGAMMAGEFIGFNMGLGFSQYFNPLLEQQTSSLGMFFYTISILLFLALNGHHYLIQSLQVSYTTTPIGSFTVNELMYEEFIKLSKMLFTVAVKISAPAIVALFLSNVVLGILSRVVPQMNVFIVGFPLQIGVGLVVLFIVTPLIVTVFKRLILSFEESFLEFVKVI